MKSKTCAYTLNLSSCGKNEKSERSFPQRPCSEQPNSRCRLKGPEGGKGRLEMAANEYGALFREDELL